MIRIKGWERETLKHIHTTYRTRKMFRPCGKESTEVRITQNMGKEWENSYRKLKRSPEERHTQTHGNLFEIFL